MGAVSIILIAAGLGQSKSNEPVGDRIDVEQRGLALLSQP
jgi:hypothetical protein